MRRNRLTESDLSRIVRRIVKENSEYKKDLELRQKLNDIFFGYDESNLTSGQGERGYLSKEYRLKRQISPRQRVERLQQVISDLESYIRDLKDELRDEEGWSSDERYDDIWRDVESWLNHNNFKPILKKVGFLFV